jgi:hypothetical protein
MSQVEVDGLTINYEVQGEGEPLLLIPYTSADHACYAFQAAGVYRALQLHRDRPSRLGRERQAGRAVASGTSTAVPRTAPSSEASRRN